MNKWIALCLLFFAWGVHAAEAPAAPAEPDASATEAPSWFKNSFLDLREDLADARQHGKRLMIFFHQDGCPYCKELVQVNFADKTIADKTRRYFDSLALNMWGDREVSWIDGKTYSEKQFASLLRVNFTPTLLFLDGQGQVVLRLNGYYPPRKFDAALDFAGQRLEKKTAFSDYLKKVPSGPATGMFIDEPFFSSPPYILQRNVYPANKPPATSPDPRPPHPTPGHITRGRGARDKPLLVLFEQKTCASCDEMHATAFKEAETRRLLDKFTVLRLNLFGKTPLIAPDGRKLNEAEWGRALKIAYTPTLVFFDASGKEVFRVDAYLKTFHLQSSLDYVASGAYRTQPNFQRFIQTRADAMREKGISVEIWK